ncbi:MAG: DUF4357 domain-containing protein [Sedimentisphaerales bacterium]
MKIQLHPAMSAEKKTSEESVLDVLICGGQTQESPITYYFNFPYKRVYAMGCDFEGGFLVLKGSSAAKYTKNKLKPQHKKLRERLIRGGILVDKGSSLEFTSPRLFKNEFEATGVICGNNKYRKYFGVWRDKAGRTPLENRLIGITELKAEYIQSEE